MSSTISASTTSGPTPSCHMLNAPRKPVFEGDYSFNTGLVKPLGYMEYSFLITTLMTPVVIGGCMAWRNYESMTPDTFMLADRSLSALSVAVSVTSSSFSAVGLMYYPEYVYYYTTMHFWDLLDVMLMASLTGVLYLPTFYQLKVTSTFEYLDMRFSKGLRYLTCFLFLLQTTLYMAVVLYSPSLILNSVTDFSTTTAIFLAGLVCTISVTLGGILAVMWMDAFKAIVVLLGLSIALGQAVNRIGGPPVVWDSLDRSKRLVFTDFRIGPSDGDSAWAYLIGYTAVWMTYYGANQTQIHKFMTCRSLKDAKLACWLTIPFNCIIIFLCLVIGMYLSVFYENCDPSKAGLLQGMNRPSLLFVMDILGDTPFSGFYYAAICVAALSTFAAGLNAMAYVIWQDIVLSFSKFRPSQETTRKFIRVIEAIVGVIILQLAYFVTTVDSFFLSVTNTINGSLGMPILTVFSLGLFVPQVNKQGAYAGLFASLGLSVHIDYIKRKTAAPYTGYADTCISNCNISALSEATQSSLLKPYSPPAPVNLDDYNFIGTMSYLYPYPITGAFGFLFGILISYITGFNDPRDIDPRLLVPICDVLFPFTFLPERLREKLRFGVNHQNKWSSGGDRPTRTIPPTLYSASVEQVGPHQSLGDINVVDDSRRWTEQDLRISDDRRSSSASGGKGSVGAGSIATTV